MLLLWSRPAPVAWTPRAVLERAGFLFVLFALSNVVFGGVFKSAYLIVPFFVWAAFRFTLAESATVVALVSGIAVWATLRGLGPFVGDTINASLTSLQAFMSIMAMVALPWPASRR